jgi:hypothetical protein
MKKNIKNKMDRQDTPTQGEQNDLMKTTDTCVSYVFDQGAQFIIRNHLPGNIAGSVPISVALTILNSILQATQTEHQESFKNMLIANIEHMFQNAGIHQSQLH